MKRTISVGRVPRTYSVHVPSALSGTVPLIVALHPLGFDGTTFESLCGLSELADRQGFIVAYPDALPYSMPIPILGPLLPTNLAWNSGGPFPDNGADDVGFISGLLTDLAAQVSYASSKTYVVGMSSGAFMAYRLAAELTDFKKVVAVAGVMPHAIWKPSIAMPVLHIHGTGDRVIPYDGGGSLGSMPVSTTITNAVTHNACNATPTTAKPHRLHPSDPAIEIDDHGVSASGANVIHYRVIGGGHVWPGRASPPALREVLGRDTRNLDTNAVAWNFLN